MHSTDAAWFGRLICVLKTSVFCFSLGFLLLFFFNFNHAFFVFSLNKKLDVLLFTHDTRLILLTC